MAFKLPPKARPASSTPEELFQELRTRKIDNPWSHQSAIWKSYLDDGVDKKDVAIQLPTGSGKTLVGLMIAEWRRRKFNERVVFLCPNRQLAHQVAEQAESRYGLKVALLVGKKDDFPPDLKSDYLAAQRIAVTTYSGLFNVNPFFEDPHTILFDDAHACESYVASMWTVRIEKNNPEHQSLFHALVNLLKPMLEPHEFARLCGTEETNEDHKWCDKVPTSLLRAIESDLIQMLDEHTAATKLRFSWGRIKHNIRACHLYYSLGEITLRPFIAPTFTHAPLAQAKHRIYMSATLGAGGDLERITGRKSIHRLPVPNGLDKQGIGRRLYFFPERSMAPSEISELQIDMLRIAKKGVILVPNEKMERHITALIIEKLGFPVFSGREIEESKQTFVNLESGVVVAANRYDGIDFPGDESHLLFVIDMPRATNLQERFLMNRFCATTLYNERRQTRIIQAFGRCTRSSSDYAAVVVQGDELYQYLLKLENRQPLHPELQAELEFGIAQADSLKPQEALENLNIFLNDRAQWEEIDGYILDKRDSVIQQPFDGISDLQSAVSHEIDYQAAIWNGDFENARQAAEKALDCLKSPKLRGYRAWWSYLTASACDACAIRGVANMNQLSRQYFTKAFDAAPTVSWLLEQAQVYLNDPKGALVNLELTKVIERIEDRFVELGASHRKNFAKEEKEILEGIHARDALQFEDAQRRLGLLLGYDAGKSDKSAAPDPWWISNRKLCFVFEDHSDAGDEGKLDATKARQASSHVNWIKAEGLVDDDANVVAILVTPVKQAYSGAYAHLNGFRVWPIASYREWAVKALAVIREIRQNFLEKGDLAWRAEAMQKLSEARLTPSLLEEQFYPDDNTTYFAAA